jgi:plastocyanin
MPNLRRRATLALAALAVVSVVLAACSAATEPPTSFDPNAPSLTATSLKFDKTELDVPGGSGFELVLHNNDSVQHNVSIYKDEGRSQRVFGGDFANNGTHVYHVQALAPGTYYFQCDVHPDMKGVVVAAQG